MFHVKILTSSVWGLGDISQVMYVLGYRWLSVQCMSSLLCWQDSSILTSLWVDKSIQNLKSCGTFRNFLVILLFWGFKRQFGGVGGGGSSLFGSPHLLYNLFKTASSLPGCHLFLSQRQEYSFLVICWESLCTVNKRDSMRVNRLTWMMNQCRESRLSECLWQ